MIEGFQVSVALPVALLPLDRQPPVGGGSIYPVCIRPLQALTLNGVVVLVKGGSFAETGQNEGAVRGRHLAVVGRRRCEPRRVFVRRVLKRFVRIDDFSILNRKKTTIKNQFCASFYKHTHTHARTHIYVRILLLPSCIGLLSAWICKILSVI